MADARDYTKDIPTLSPENWAKANFESRKEALIQLEKQLAEEQKRPSCAIEAAFYPNNQKNGIVTDRGEFDGNTNTISVNAALIQPGHPASEHPALAVSAVVHEGRHATQVDVARNPQDHPEVNKETAETWRDNLKNYRTPDGGTIAYLTYRNQPVELDARSFEREKTSAMYPSMSQETLKALDTQEKTLTKFETVQLKTGETLAKAGDSLTAAKEKVLGLLDRNKPKQYEPPPEVKSHEQDKTRGMGR